MRAMTYIVKGVYGEMGGGGRAAAPRRGRHLIMEVVRSGRGPRAVDTRRRGARCRRASPEAMEEAHSTLGEGGRRAAAPAARRIKQEAGSQTRRAVGVVTAIEYLRRRR